MRSIICILSALAVFMLAAPAHAIQDSMPPAGWQTDGPQNHAEQVFDLLLKGDNEQAFKLFFSKGRYPKNTLEKIQFDYYQLVKQQGPPATYEKIFEHRAGNAMIRIKYVLLFKTQPMMFDLYYYNMGKGWLLKSFTLSKDIKKVFER